MFWRIFFIPLFLSGIELEIFQSQVCRSTCEPFPLPFMFPFSWVTNYSRVWSKGARRQYLECCSSSSNQISMSCQPHRVTSGQSNLGHKQIHISKLFSHIYQPSVKSIYKTNYFTNIKHTYTNIRHKFSKS